MIHVEFDPSRLAGAQKAFWDGWIEDADQATRDAIEAWETSNHRLPIALKQNIWKYLRDWLLANVFQVKCAYCEAPLTRDYAPAEHYRPKGAVAYKQQETGQPADTTTEDETGQSRPHPGYFWLAYHWKNLIPSCDKCNSGQGKQNQFPITAQHRMVKHLTPEEQAAVGNTPFRSPNHPDVLYLEPDELDQQEQPLLLHPYDRGNNDPRRHLCFGPAGIEAAREIGGAPSPKGLRTIEVCRLSDDELRRARDAVQRNALKDVLIAWAAQISYSPSPAQALTNVCQGPAVVGLAAGQIPYSSAAIDCVVDYINRMNLVPAISIP